MSDSPPKKKIRVLIVEDSPVVREFLVFLFESDPEMEIVGVACNGEEAIAAVERLTPDVITMDINMPKMNGLEATQHIMRNNPIPIVIVSGSWECEEVERTFKAMEAGALAVLPRPPGPGHPNSAAQSRELIRTVKAMAEVKVVRRWAPRIQGTPPSPRPVLPNHSKQKTIRFVAIGASTGGPLVLQQILSALPANLPFPIAIVQHMADGFMQGFIEWLSNSTKFPVHLAANGQVMEPGHAYVAPDAHHLTIGPNNRAVLNTNPPDNGLRPSVRQLFQSVARIHGSHVLAILLTGMGTDGAAELKELRELGALTVAQDQATCVVFGMPGEAQRLEAARYVLPPIEIARLILSSAKSPP